MNSIGQTRQGRPVTQDMDLITAVIRVAQDPGYVLIGPTERVWRRHEHRRGHIEHVPGYEDAAVHQLITQRLLRIGGSVNLRYREHEGTARVVLVTRAAVSQMNRWRSYKPNSCATQKCLP